ncbi:MAG: GIY-YIG nuclease family protein [Hyphomicrobium sp.]
MKRQEPQRTGVYFLVGDDPNQPSKSLVYIGEGDCVADRIKAHAKDEAKDFWTRVCFVTSKDTNITKAHVRYLESRLVELTKTAERANVANANEPGAKSLPESDVADMEYFLSQMQIVLPVLGLEFLRPAPKGLSEAICGQQPSDATGSLALFLKSETHGIEAFAVEAGGEFTVLSQSQATSRDDFVSNTYAALRAQLIADRRLVASTDGKVLRFADDVVFTSPSAAAAVIFNRNTNGRTAWKVRGTNKTLKEWQDAQIDIVQLFENSLK